MKIFNILSTFILFFILTGCSKPVYPDYDTHQLSKNPTLKISKVIKNYKDRYIGLKLYPIYDYENRDKLIKVESFNSSLEDSTIILQSGEARESRAQGTSKSFDPQGNVTAINYFAVFQIGPYDSIFKLKTKDKQIVEFWIDGY